MNKMVALNKLKKNDKVKYNGTYGEVRRKKGFGHLYIAYIAGGQSFPLPTTNSTKKEMELVSDEVFNEVLVLAKLSDTVAWSFNNDPYMEERK